MNKKILTTESELKTLYNQSALTWEGLVDNDESLGQVIDWLKEHGVDTAGIVFNVVKGETMNKIYKLDGKNAYETTLNIVALTGINTAKIVTARFQVGGRWFDDIVNNNKDRQGGRK